MVILPSQSSSCNVRKTMTTMRLMLILMLMMGVMEVFLSLISNMSSSAPPQMMVVNAFCMSRSSPSVSSTSRSSRIILPQRVTATSYSLSSSSASSYSSISSTQTNERQQAKVSTTSTALVQFAIAEMILRYDKCEGDEPLATTNTTTTTTPQPTSSSKRSWKKTRNYLYHSRDQLTTEQIMDVLNFLDGQLPKSVVRDVLQQIPRIVRKPVDTFLQPTTEFLIQLWGDELFIQAIQKNPSLLLSRGVGYNPMASRRRSKKTTTAITTTTTTSRLSTSNSIRTVGTETIVDENHSGLAYGDPKLEALSDSTTATTLITKGTYNIDTVESLLMEFMDLSPTSIRRLKRSAPFVFGLTTEKVRTVLAFIAKILSESEPQTNDIVAADSSIDTAVIVVPGAEKQHSRHQTRKAVSTVLGKVIMAHPHILNLSVETNLKPRIDFLTKTCQMNTTHIAKAIQASKGSILGLSVEQNLKPTIDFLWEKVFRGVEVQFNKDVEENDKDTRLFLESVSRDRLRRCILAHPSLLGLSTTNLQTKVDFFNSIGPTLAYRIASKCPTVYSLNLQQNILPTIEFLSRVWGITTTDVTTTLAVTTVPRNGVSSSSTRTTTKNIETTPGTVITGYHPPAIVFDKPNKKLEQLLYEYPNILTLSVEGNLRPTMNFFNRTGYTCLNDSWELRQPVYQGSDRRGTMQYWTTGIDDPATYSTPATTHAQVTHKNRNRDRTASQPVQSAPTRLIRGRYISASLYNRLLPRWHFFLSTAAAVAAPPTTASISKGSITSSSDRAGEVEEQRNGPPSRKTETVMPLIPPFDLLVMASDKVFCEKLGFHHIEYEQFKQDAIPRLKFSSQFDTWLKTGRPIDL